ncbi:hypothetical protein HMPREF9554_00845 [Treponema phagedenis F0421]|nr:hypothetical protein HMPREF9554_00845 [Treponema phagedenis F0421]
MENTTNIQNEYFTRQDLCKIFQLSMGTVDKLDIPRVYFGRVVRFRKSDVEAFIKKGGRKCTSSRI